jgi:hypothetical protein
MIDAVTVQDAPALAFEGLPLEQAGPSHVNQQNHRHIQWTSISGVHA